MSHVVEETAKKLFKHRTEVCGRAYFGVCVRITASASLPSKFQDLALRFPGLSTIKVIFQDFPGVGSVL